jgi:hypothetical protein
MVQFVQIVVDRVHRHAHSSRIDFSGDRGAPLRAGDRSS